MKIIDDIMSDVLALNPNIDKQKCLYITPKFLRDILTARLVPAGELNYTEPVICYFPTEEDREDFIQAVMEAKPGMRSIKL